MLHTASNMPHGLGLLTTVASLPPKYRSRYLSIKTKCEIPLDLSVKPLSPISNNSNNDNNKNNNKNIESLSPQIAQDVPMATNFTEVYTEPTSVDSPKTNDKPMTPPLTPTPTPIAALSSLTSITMPTIRATIVSIKRKYIEMAAEDKEYQEFDEAAATIVEENEDEGGDGSDLVAKGNLAKLARTMTITKQSKESQVTETTTANATASTSTTTISTDISSKANHVDKKNHIIMTPLKPIKQCDTAPRTAKSQHASSTKTTSTTMSTTTTTATNKSSSTKNKATRKLKFDEETSSPVSGTIIRPLEDVTGGSEQYSNGDIDPRYNIVEISEESKAELAAIKNVIGDYICKLCRLKFEDAFGLARHRCACIVLLEYRCPECGKQFNCPANLASHRRWHKPKKDTSNSSSSTSSAKKENQNTINTLGAKKSQEADLPHACTECGKKFKRQAYLRKHQTTHVTTDKVKGKLTPTPTPTPKLISNSNRVSATVVAITDATSTYQSYSGSTSSVSSVHSYHHDTHEEEHANVAYDYDADTMSECSSRSSSSVGYGRLQIVENTGLTEEENIAAAALTNLRNCASVIKHTTLAH